jgi:hypothetical protein
VLREEHPKLSHEPGRVERLAYPVQGVRRGFPASPRRAPLDGFAGGKQAGWIERPGMGAGAEPVYEGVGSMWVQERPIVPVDRQIREGARESCVEGADLGPSMHDPGQWLFEHDIFGHQ